MPAAAGGAADVARAAHAAVAAAADLSMDELGQTTTLLLLLCFSRIQIGDIHHQVLLERVVCYMCQVNRTA